ncbi:MAG TPA: hypothetical protein VHR45_26035 [Thermoanaerobaculia bacterium]|nr:hypothetical protein [Thermoanaerobaculia bacterium]
MRPPAASSYDLVVAVHFTATPEERAAYAADPENHWIPTYSPEQAGLVVGFVLDRWVASWEWLDEPADVPACRRRAVVTITQDPGSPYGVAFHEA